MDFMGPGIPELAPGPPGEPFTIFDLKFEKTHIFILFNPLIKFVN
jgi:hypothetical protein